MEYIFTLKYQLTEHDNDPDALVERLGEAGCDDALVGIGQPGRLALEFTREAESAQVAVRSALADVKRAIPSAKLVEAVPDFVGLTDVAEIMGVSPQALSGILAYNAPKPDTLAAVLLAADWDIDRVLNLRLGDIYEIATPAASLKDG